MTNAIDSSWRSRCTEIGLDPFEVRKVSDRYDMYCRFTAGQNSPVLGLSRWYRWYRLEKLADGHAQLTPPAEGCSVQADTAPVAPLVSEQTFLDLLQCCRGESASTADSAST